MSSNAISGMGTKCYRWNIGTGAWDVQSEITSVDGPQKTRATIEVTALDSEGGYEEVIPGLRKGGTVALSMNFTRGTFNTMNADFESDVRQNYCIVFPDPLLTTVEFEGYVVECPLSTAVGDKVSANVSIMVTGKPIVYDGDSGGPTIDPTGTDWWVTP